MPVFCTLKKYLSIVETSLALPDLYQYSDLSGRTLATDDIAFPNDTRHSLCVTCPPLDNDSNLSDLSHEKFPLVCRSPTSINVNPRRVVPEDFPTLHTSSVSLAINPQDLRGRRLLTRIRMLGTTFDSVFGTVRLWPYTGLLLSAALISFQHKHSAVHRPNLF